MIPDSNPPKRLIRWIGIAAGVATATRYPTGLILIIPGMILLARADSWAAFRQRLRAGKPIRTIWKAVVNSGTRTLLAFWLLGLFIADPFLFLSPMQARYHMAVQASYIETKQFSLLGWFDPSRIVEYLTHLLPYGTLPALWVLLYAGLIIVILSRDLRRKLLPYLCVTLIYFVFMAKAYATAEFIRPLIFLFPFLAIFAAAGLAWLWDRCSRSPVFPGFPVGRTLLACTVAGILISTALYDWAYVNAMARTDPRIALHDYLASLRPPGGGGIRIGSVPRDLDYFAKIPTLRFVPNLTLIAKSRRDGYRSDVSDLDCFLVSTVVPTDRKDSIDQVQYLLRSGAFHHTRRFDNPIRAFGITFRFHNNPHDLQYPFPVLILLE